MNELIAAGVLGAVQGLTEFLPISSTAHLILVTDFLQLDPKRFGLNFDVALHLGTALAVLLYFAGTWLSILFNFLRLRWRIPILLVFGTIPGAVAGVAFQSLVETTLRGPLVIVIGLVVGSAAIGLAELLASQRRHMDELNVLEALFIGVAQALALVPGISRSGITISGGLARDLHREEATRFSFLLATPIIVGAALKTVVDARITVDPATALKTVVDVRAVMELIATYSIVVVGFGVAFLSGFVAIAFMVNFLKAHSLSWFIGYRLALAALILIALGSGALSP